MFWDGRHAASTLGGALDWEMVARGFGVAARSVEDPDKLEDALVHTLAEPGPALLRVAIAADADCLPMFRPGGPAREMIG
jgi:acetolactate synthase-1/2/3 large subunit